MKKIYKKPNTEIIFLETETLLAAASPDHPVTTKDETDFDDIKPGGNTSETFSKGGSLWDEDWD